MKVFYIFPLLLCSFFVSADICEDINSLANDWNEVANFLNESQEDDVFSDSEIAILERYVENLAVDTYDLADALIDLGNRRETKLGTSLRKIMSRLADGDDIDLMIEDLDALVDTIDKVTDYCDG